MFLSDRYHFEHNGTCDGVDPYASTSKVCSYQTDIILNTTVHVLQVLRFFPRRFLHVMCFPVQMFSPCTVLSCSDVFSRNSDSSTIKTHHSDINTSNPNTYYVLQSILVTSVALSFVLIVTNM